MIIWSKEPVLDDEAAASASRSDRVGESYAAQS
jgi:hypothetical protein